MKKALAVVVAFFALLGVEASAPVVFVHGWNSDGEIWDDLRKLLVQNAGYDYADFRVWNYYDWKDADGRKVDLDTPIEDIAALAGARIAAEVESSGGPVDVVAHSMGGLVIRAALAYGYLSTNAVSRFVTLATPHYGEQIGVDGASNGLQTHEMAYGSSFLWDLAYDWHFRGNRIPRTLCVVGVEPDFEDVYDMPNDGLVPAFSAVLGDCPAVYVKRYHSDVFSLFGRVIYECDGGADDAVYRAVSLFLTEDRVLRQEELSFEPGSHVYKYGTLFYRAAETVGGNSIAFDSREKIGRDFTVSATGKSIDVDWRQHGGEGYEGEPYGVELVSPNLPTGEVDFVCRLPDGRDVPVRRVPVEGGRVTMLEVGADGTVACGSPFSSYVPPEPDPGRDPDSDRTIVLAPEYGPFRPGEKISVQLDPSTIGCSVKGLPSGFRFNKKTGVVSGASKKGDVEKVVTFKKKVDGVKVSATTVFKVGPLPQIRIVREGDTSVKVKGEGGYPIGKKVSLSVSIPKGTAFKGWYRNGEPFPDVEKYLEKSVKWVMEDADLELTVVFKPEVVKFGAMFPPVLYVGEWYSLPVDVSAESPIKSISCKRLPSGLKYNRKTGRIEGVPKKECVGIATVTVKTKYGFKATGSLPFSVGTR